MVAVDKDRPSAREFALLSERVLTVAGIYGPNASGKSNLLEALDWLSMAVRHSLRSWGPLVPREPFKFGNGPQTPSAYEIEMVVNGVRYAYLLEVDTREVVFEGLYSYPERRRRMLFEREGLRIAFRRGLGSLTGTRELLTPTTLALSAARRFEEPDVQPFAQQVAGIYALGARRAAAWRERELLDIANQWLTERVLFEEPDRQPSVFDDPDLNPPNDRKSALGLLRFADLGIDDVRMIEARDDDVHVSSGIGREPRRELRLIHRAAGQELPFELSEESAGTQTWFSLIGPTLRALRTGRVMVVDEIDASLHPRLSARLLELFQDPQTNPSGAQLIFTTHDTSLLNHLNRDEVWLTEKDESGSTRLTALAEYGGDKVRRSLNLEKAYLQGRFGAVPELDQFLLHRALGLTSYEP